LLQDTPWPLPMGSFSHGSPPPPFLAPSPSDQGTHIICQPLVTQEFDESELPSHPSVLFVWFNLFLKLPPMEWELSWPHVLTVRRSGVGSLFACVKPVYWFFWVLVFPFPPSREPLRQFFVGGFSVHGTPFLTSISAGLLTPPVEAGGVICPLSYALCVYDVVLQPPSPHIGLHPIAYPLFFPRRCLSRAVASGPQHSPCCLQPQKNVLPLIERGGDVSQCLFDLSLVSMLVVYHFWIAKIAFLILTRPFSSSSFVPLPGRCSPTFKPLCSTTG